jgi:FkbM family methyltransferase
MVTPLGIVKEAYRIGTQEGPRALASAIGRFYRHNLRRYVDPGYWRGRVKDELVVTCRGESVTFDTTTPVAKEWFYPRYVDGRLHEPALTERLLDLLDGDDVFYDIGANVGYFTLFASEICADGHVHAFELDPRYVEVIEASLRRNGTSATVVQRAVSDESDATVSYADEIIPRITTDRETTRTARTITIDEYRDANPTPTVMKIDVEGFEYHALRGARETLERPELGTLFVEVHPDRLRQYGHDESDVFDLLTEAGFDCYAFDDHRSADSASRRELHPEEIAGNTMLECHR